MIPKIRFPEFVGEYEENTLAHYLEENKKRNKEKTYGKEDVFSVSREYGVVNQIEFQGKSLAGEDVSNYHIVEEGNIVYTKSPLKETPFGIIKVNKNKAGIVSTLYAVYHCKDNVNGEYIDYYFSNSLRVNQYLKPLVNIGAKHDMKVHNDVAISGYVFFPSIKEQEKVVQFLNLLDKKIANQQEIVKSLSNIKTGYAQSIFKREIRFKSDNGDDFPNWEIHKIGEHIVEYTEKTVIKNQYPVLTSSRRGIMLQSEYFKDRQVTTDDNVGYFVIPRGYSTYRSRSDDGKFQFNTNNIIDNGIISYFYPVFKFQNIDSRYAIFYLNNCLNETLYVETAGTAQSVLSIKKLKGLSMEVPCEDEQKKIADFLEICDKKINAEQEVLDKWLNIKKGLLQQMFV